MSLYHWDSAPKWAKYAATDNDGFSCWYEHKPIEVDLGFWDIEDLCHRFQSFNSYIDIDWENSLEERPVDDLTLSLKKFY